MDGASAADRELFGRIVKFVIALLAVMEVVIAVATIYFDFTFVGIALLIGMPIIAVYLAYLTRLVASPPRPAGYGGGGNRTRVRGRTEQSVYERSPCLLSPAGRFTDNPPTGQPSCVVTPQAIGSPLVPSPIVGAELRASGPTRVDVALPSFD